MQLDLISVFTNLLELFALLAVGFIAVRTKTVPEDSSADYSALLMNITYPCSLFLAIATKAYDPSFLHDALIMMLLGFLIFPAGVTINGFIARLLRVKEGARGAWAFCATWPNNGNMGYPIILSLLGSDALALAGMLNISFCLTAFTIGAMTICRDAEEKKAKLDLKSILCTNCNFGIVMGLIFYFVRIPVPKVVLTPMTFLGNCTTPLAMIISGMALGRCRGRQVFTDRDTYSATFFKLLVSPIATLFLLRLIPFRNPLLVPTLILTLAMPAASSGSVLAEAYHGNLTFVAKTQLVSNILCLATIPLICMLM